MAVWTSRWRLQKNVARRGRREVEAQSSIACRGSEQKPIFFVQSVKVLVGWEAKRGYYFHTQRHSRNVTSSVTAKRELVA